MFFKKVPGVKLITDKKNLLPIKSAVLLGVLTIGASTLLSGCTTNYTRKDIKSYVKEELGLEEYSISRTYEEKIEEEDGYTDKLWTVVDEEHGVTFHVVDNYYWGMEALSNYLVDDYEASVFLQYQDQLPKSSLVEDGRINITVEEDNHGIVWVSMEAWYGDRAELQSIFDQLTEYRDFFRNLGFNSINTIFTVRYEGPESFPCKGQLVGAETYAGLESDMDEAFHNALQRYILAGLDYRLNEVLVDTTAEEQQEALLADDTPRVGIVRDNGETEYYDDLIGNIYCYGLSVSTLYRVLEREGLGPVGDERHFTCIGADGTNYEFSCDFVAEDFDGEEGAYYLADGVPVQLSYAYNIHIQENVISKIFGINIVIDWNQEITEKESTAINLSTKIK